jgi:Spy/CpxP family protein refolding chaperone
MNLITRGVMTLCLVLASASAASAQANPPGAPDNPRRAMLEDRLRERMAMVVRQRLALTDAQMTKLQATNKQFEGQRMQLMTRERDVRRQLRQEILAGDGANQAKVGQLLDQAMQIERQRLDLQQNEQRQLATFLTPVQRARLFGLQNELRRRAQEMRNGQPRKGMRMN